MLWPLLISSALLVSPVEQSAESVLFQQAWLDLQTLSSDAFAGRATGTEGNRQAQLYLQQRFTELGLQGAPFLRPFSYEMGWSQYQGHNIVGVRPGCIDPNKYVWVTAHYDHLPGKGRKIYNGADDNASGVAGLLFLAGQTQQQCPAYTIVFVATDAEERGLYGAKALLKTPLYPMAQWLFVVNLDMISRGEKRNRLYAAGSKTLPLLNQAPSWRQSPVRLVLAHDQRQKMLGQQQAVDWPNASDHAPFRKAGIPYVYFGVDVHPDYHQPTDDWQRIEPEFYRETLLWINTVFWQLLAIPAAELRPTT